jgi:hypothetical protein
MDLFSELFVHERDLRLLICKSCATGIPPAQVSTHLKSRHPSVSVAARKDITAILTKLSDLAWTVETLTLSTTSRPILSIPTQKGFQCKAPSCGHVCAALRAIRDHCTVQHGWASTQARGGDYKQKQSQPSNRIWEDNLLCQRVFRAVGWPAYRMVQASALAPTTDITQEILCSWKNDQSKRQARQAQAVIRESHRVKVDPWLELTAWVPHLKGFSRVSLLEAREIPDNNKECELGTACKAMRRVIRKAFQSCRFEIVGRHTLELIERRETGAPSNEKPFYARQRVRTIKKYTRILLYVFCYLWRSYSRAERPQYKLSSLQESALLQAQQSIEQGDDIILEKHCLRFWIWLLDHTLLADEHESGLLSGVAVLGLKPDRRGGGWVPAHHFSSTLSALVTTSKALVVYYAHCQREDAVLAAGEDSAPLTSELVREMSTRFLVLSDYNHTATPMNRLLRLRALARSESRRRNADGVLSWYGDRLLINQQSFSLDDLRSTVKGLYETARMQLLRDVLLLDLDTRDQVRPGTSMLPELDLDLLVDQPADRSTGYSFFRHPDNNMESWQTWLLFRVVEEPALRARFIRGIDTTKQPPRTLWYDAAIAAYMKAVRRFKETLFTLVHLSGGGPARGTEITSIQCENSTDGTGHRGVFIDAGLVSFVATYHKGYDFSKKVKAIHRYVPREVSELVVYFLGLGRPFIDDLQMMHYNVEEPTTFIWEPLPDEEEEESDEEDAHEEEEDREGTKAMSANPDGYWGTDRIRRVLREQTSRCMAAALNTQSWRHAYPAIHRKLALDSKARDWLDVLYFNKEPKQDDAQARQSGHTAEIEEGNYGRSLHESPFQTVAERVKFRRVSEDWHRILEFTSALRAEPCRTGNYAVVMAQ